MHSKFNKLQFSNIKKEYRNDELYCLLLVLHSRIQQIIILTSYYLIICNSHPE